ncbi:hypothetical protein ACFQ36_02910 [Arthrobacter sp. GCM10027362]|uniref:hypothetical protein n=1 Tax=Arthrobacter sp. GCM10027362 TaxID=3273379 RepID=UPI00363047FD
MPFYLEYTVHGMSGVRSAVPGETLDEAAAAAADLLRESGCQTGLLRWSPAPSEEPGSGEVVATYTDTVGWEPLDFRRGAEDNVK